MLGNKTYYIDQINSTKANKMTAYYHYSKVGFKKAILNLGIFRRTDNRLVGVLQWGCSFQENIRLDKYVKEPVSKEEYLELNRFSMADSEPRNAESQAIALGIKWIKKNKPNVRLLVSYAGRKEGNYGFIYQATNWEYLGYFVSPGFWSLDGHEKHLMTIWCNYRNHRENETMMEYLYNKYKDVRQTWTKQFIYIYRLDTSLTPASEVLPYPKATTDYPIKIREHIFQRDDNAYNNPIEEVQDPVEYYYEKEKLLFSRATMRRRGLIPEKETQKLLMYNGNGEFQQELKTKEDFDKFGFKLPGIKLAIKQNRSYKNCFFKYYPEGLEAPLEIDVPYVCIIDEISFPSYTEASKYLGVSRQAVQQASQRHSKKIKDKEIIWPQ